MARTSLAPSPLLAPLPPLQTQSKKLIFIVSQCKTTCQNNLLPTNNFAKFQDFRNKTKAVVENPCQPWQSQFPPISDNNGSSEFCLHSAVPARLCSPLNLTNIENIVFLHLSSAPLSSRSFIFI